MLRVLWHARRRVGLLRELVTVRVVMAIRLPPLEAMDERVMIDDIDGSGHWTEGYVSNYVRCCTRNASCELQAQQSCPSSDAHTKRDYQLAIQLP